MFTSLRFVTIVALCSLSMPTQTINSLQYFKKQQLQKEITKLNSAILIHKKNAQEYLDARNFAAAITTLFITSVAMDKMIEDQYNWSNIITSLFLLRSTYNVHCYRLEHVSEAAKIQEKINLLLEQIKDLQNTQPDTAPTKN